MMPRKQGPAAKLAGCIGSASRVAGLAYLLAGWLAACEGTSGPPDASTSATSGDYDAGPDGSNPNPECVGDKQEPNDTEQEALGGGVFSAGGGFTLGGEVAGAADRDVFRFTGVRTASMGNLVVATAFISDAGVALTVELEARCSGLTGSCRMGDETLGSEAIHCASTGLDGVSADAEVGCAEADVVVTLRLADGGDASCVPYTLTVVAYDAPP